MGVSKAILAGIGGCLLALAPAPLAAQQDVPNPPDPWVHAGTGTSFPAALAGFRRGRVVEYTEDGRDASVGYSIARGDDRLTVTLYVYPVIEGLDCRQTFEDAKASVAKHQGAWLVGQRRESSPRGAGPNRAWFARYTLPAGSMAATIPESWSDVYLYCPTGGEWLVKYRATWNAEVDFSDDIAGLIRAIDWPDHLDE
jgi:hypothetical protein